MIAFTTRQREILKLLLEANKPIGSVEMARLLHITPRQVNDSIKGVRIWLKDHGQDLQVLPGVGFAVDLTDSQIRALFQKLNIHSDVHIILSVSQRQLDWRCSRSLAHGRRWNWIVAHGIPLPRAHNSSHGR